ncbi:MAG: PAS domain-containing protein, partial [Chthoniobacteraceae bacterium]
FRALEAGADEYFCLAAASSLAIARTLAQTVRRSRAEIQLRSRERQLATAQHLARLGSWEWDLRTNEISCSDELVRICGGEPRPFLLEYERWADRALPDATGRALLAVEAPGSFTAEREITLSDGSIRAVHTRADIIFNESGRAERLIGICQDVSDHRRVENERSILAAELDAQQRALDEMVQNVPGVVWEWYMPETGANKRSFVSDYAETMLGYPMECWDDPEFGFKVTAPEDLPHVVKEMECGFAKGHFRPSRYRLVAADGHYVPVEIHRAVIRDEKGKVIGTRGVTMDLTDREAAEAALAKSEETLRTIVENSRDIIYRFDLETDSSDYVSAAVRTLGYTPEELLAEGKVRTLPHPDDRKHVENHFRQLIDGSSATSLIEYRILAKNGEYRWVSDSLALLRDPSGKPVAVIGNVRDITEQKLAQAALENATRQLVETSRLAGMAEVASNVLHNIGNVLNSMNVSVGWLRHTLLNQKSENLGRLSALLTEHAHDLPHFLAEHPQGRELPGYLLDLSQYLSSERIALLEDLVDLARNLEHIKGVIAMQQSHSRVGTIAESVLASEVLEDALRINSSALQRSHVEIIREYQQVPLLNVEKHLLLQVLVNLVSNACSALDAVSTSRRLIVSIAPQGSDSVVITVTDNGQGIPAENMPRLFEHGFTTRTDGHGYGLHSAALAAADLGGSLRAISDGPGNGATFTLAIPLVAPDRPSPGGEH